MQVASDPSLPHIRGGKKSSLFSFFWERPGFKAKVQMLLASYSREYNEIYAFEHD